MSQDAFARVLLETADAVDRAEQRIKRAILDAAARGDTAAVQWIVQRWLTLPVLEVLNASEARPEKNSNSDDFAATPELAGAN